MSLAVVGSEMFSLGFDLIGVQDIFDADKNNAVQVMEDLISSKDFKLVIVEEQVMGYLPRFLWHRVVNNSHPLFVIIGPDAGNVLDEKVKRAVGADITGNRKGGIRDDGRKR